MSMKFDAEFGEPTEHLDHLVVVVGRAPHTIADDPHCPVAKSGYLKVAADREGAGGRS